MKTIPTQQEDFMATSCRRYSVRPSNLTVTSQMKHPTTSRRNVAKSSKWYVSTTSYWNVVRSPQEDVTTASHQCVTTTSQPSLEWNNQRCLSGTSARHLCGTSPWRPINTPLQRFLWVPNETPNNVIVVPLHHASELRCHEALLLGLYYFFMLNHFVLIYYLFSLYFKLTKYIRI